MFISEQQAWSQIISEDFDNGEVKEEIRLYGDIILTNHFFDFFLSYCMI